MSSNFCGFETTKNCCTSFFQVFTCLARKIPNLNKFLNFSTLNFSDFSQSMNFTNNILYQYERISRLHQWDRMHTGHRSKLRSIWNLWSIYYLVGANDIMLVHSRNHLEAAELSAIAATNCSAANATNRNTYILQRLSRKDDTLWVQRHWALRYISKLSVKVYNYFRNPTRRFRQYILSVFSDKCKKTYHRSAAMESDQNCQ